MLTKTAVFIQVKVIQPPIQFSGDIVQLNHANQRVSSCMLHPVIGETSPTPDKETRKKRTANNERE